MFGSAMVIAGAGIAYVMRSESPVPRRDLLLVDTNPTARPQPVRRAIDGVALEPDASQPGYYAVMIDNMIDARPQSGPADASLVIEAPVEGGITRWLAVFPSDAKVTRIGPIRSARPYYVDWAMEFDALYAHVGGSPEALEKLHGLAIRDFDEYFRSKYFWRDQARKSPHQVFTSTELLAGAGTGDSAPVDPWQFKDLPDPDSRKPAGKDIVIPYGAPAYDVRWTYDPESGGYRRFQGGREQFDDGGHAVSAKNVVVQFTSVESTDAVDRKSVGTIGGGKALVAIDGKVRQGTWKKKDGHGRTRFYDDLGNEITFNAGQTWIQVVSESAAIIF